jgi:hypothetical protein
VLVVSPIFLYREKSCMVTPNPSSRGMTRAPFSSGAPSLASVSSPEGANRSERRQCASGASWQSVDPGQEYAGHAMCQDELRRASFSQSRPAASMHPSAAFPGGLDEDATLRQEVSTPTLDVRASLDSFVQVQETQPFPVGRVLCDQAPSLPSGSPWRSSAPGYGSATSRRGSPNKRARWNAVRALTTRNSGTVRGLPPSTRPPAHALAPRASE